MSRKTSLVFSIVVVLLAFPFSLWALGLDIGIRAGGGMAMGTSDDEAKTGKLRWAADAGLALDAYLFSLPRVEIGLSTGADYLMLNYHGITDMDLGPYGTSKRTSDSRYNYLYFPVMMAGRVKLVRDIALIAKVGCYAGYFLGGTSDQTYDPEITGILENGEEDLDDSNTEEWDLGLRLSAGAEIMSWGLISLLPELIFDLGLLDTSKDSVEPSKDTHWALTANLGIKYSLF